MNMLSSRAQATSLVPVSGNPFLPFSPQLPAEAADKLASFRNAMAGLSPQAFAQQLATAALMPIAMQMIEEAVTRRLFLLDQISTAAQIYKVKRRQRVATIAKYGAAVSNIVSYDTITVVPYYIQTKPEIERSDILDNAFDAAGDALTDAGREMAVMEDLEFLRLFDAYAPTVADPGASRTVPTVSAGPGGIGYVLSGNTYAVGTSVTAPSGGIAGDIAASDVLTGRGLMQQIGLNPTTLMINPVGLGRWMAQDNFLRYLNVGNTEVHATGLMSVVLGTRVVLSRLVNSKSAFLMDPVELARWVEREPLQVLPEFEGLRVRWLVFERVAPFLRNANALMRLQWYSGS